MHNSGGSPTVTNCTFSGNTAANFGGGMFNARSSPTVSNTGFCNNTPDAIEGSPPYTDGGGNSLMFCPPPIAKPDLCPSDVDGDGIVGTSDLLALLAAWGACP